MKVQMFFDRLLIGVVLILIGVVGMLMLMKYKGFSKHRLKTAVVEMLPPRAHSMPDGLSDEAQILWRLAKGEEIPFNDLSKLSNPATFERAAKEVIKSGVSIDTDPQKVGEKLRVRLDDKKTLIDERQLK